MTNKVVIAVSKADERKLKAGKVAKPPAAAKAEVAATAEDAPSPAPAKTDIDGEEDAPDQSGIASDVPLKEAQHILLDLIQLTPRKAGLAATKAL